MDIDSEVVIIKQESAETDETADGSSNDYENPQCHHVFSKIRDGSDATGFTPRLPVEQTEDSADVKVKWMNEVEEGKYEDAAEDPLSGFVTVKEEPASDNDDNLETDASVRLFSKTSTDGGSTVNGVDSSSASQVTKESGSLPAVRLDESAVSGMSFTERIRQQWKGIKLDIINKKSSLGLENVRKGCKIELGSILEEVRTVSATSEPSNLFACATCSYTSRHKAQLRVHLRRHIVEKPFRCDVCGTGFMRVDALRKHSRNHTGEKPFVCEICDARFSDSRIRNRHRKGHINEKPHACDFCEYRTKHIEDLKIHKRTHTGERPYVCMVCKATFRRADNLERHKRTHTGDKPYECHLCGKRLVAASSLKRHMATHGAESPLDR